ncbi:MAG: hypothetical protein HS115_08250 [Spirochaetales bacterium]|nr:hypothetical protein [Spirochaetales bacterium]
MNVTGKMLLSSAETILRGRPQAQQTGNPPGPPQATDMVTAQGSAMQNRMHELSSRLKQTQADYTREQMRLSYLKNGQLDRSIAIQDQPLFLPEEVPGPELQDKVEAHLENLLHTLRSVQVEMENLSALNFRSADGIRMTGQDYRSIDPARVAQLTRS